MRVLVFAPHPDDEIIGCGGYLTKLIKMNNIIDVVYLMTYSKERELEIDRVKQFMNFNETHLLREGEKFEKDSGSLLEKIIHTIRHSKPNQVIIPHINESDKDHRLLSSLLLENFYLINSNFLLREGDNPHRIESMLGYEIWTPISSPQLYIDITEFIEIKKKAMRLYPSQLKHKDFISMFEGLNRYRSILSDSKGFAEALEIYKMEESFIRMR